MSTSSRIISLLQSTSPRSPASALPGCVIVLILAWANCIQGCATSKPHVPDPVRLSVESSKKPDSPAIMPVSHQVQEEVIAQPETLPPVMDRREAVPAAEQPQQLESLEDLEAAAIDNNPTLRRMRQEADAERAKVGYTGALPDPNLSSMFYGEPMNYVPDKQLAELQFSQMIPWLGRLRADAQRAHLEALAAENMYYAERLRVIGDLRTAWFKYYILNKQVDTTEADKSQLQSLITTANARTAAGDAQPGDVLMATLELSSLQEQLLGYRQQIVATQAEINRLASRDPREPITPPEKLVVELPSWNYELLSQIAMEAQPELRAARFRTAATRWGIEVAQLQRRPDLTFGAGWMVMKADPADTMPGAGDDSWTLGVMSSIPIWHHKYDAMYSEAASRHSAAHASEDEVAQRVNAMLQDLWEQARAGQQTVELYEKTILPQARQTFQADQQSLVNNAVTFDRVIRDYRTLLNLELGYHRALGQLAATLARIRQTVGVDLLASPEPSPLPR